MGDKERCLGQGRHFHGARLSQDSLGGLLVGHSHARHDAALLTGSLPVTQVNPPRGHQGPAGCWQHPQGARAEAGMPAPGSPIAALPDSPSPAPVPSLSQEPPRCSRSDAAAAPWLPAGRSAAAACFAPSADGWRGGRSQGRGPGDQAGCAAPTVQPTPSPPTRRGPGSLPGRTAWPGAARGAGAVAVLGTAGGWAPAPCHIQASSCGT